MASPGLVPKVASGLAIFYVTTAAIFAGVAVGHELTRYWSYEGPSLPQVAFSSSGQEAQDSLLAARTVHAGRTTAQVEQPRHSLVAFYPNLALRSLSLGLAPDSLYGSDGATADTFLKLHEGDLAQTVATGAMPASTMAVPLYVSVLGFAAAVAWALARPALGNRGLAWALGFQVAVAMRQARGLGLHPLLVETVSVVAILVGVGVAVLTSPTLREMRRDPGPRPSRLRRRGQATPTRPRAMVVRDPSILDARPQPKARPVRMVASRRVPAAAQAARVVMVKPGRTRNRYPVMSVAG